MATITFENIYSAFLDKVNDYDFVSDLIEEDIIYERMYGWLKSVSAMPRVRKLFQAFSIDNEEKTMDFSMKVPLDDESDSDFVTQLFGIGMAWKWSEPIYKSTLNTLQVFGGKEEKFYAQSSHMAELEKIYKNGRNELYCFIRDRSTYFNDYLNS